MVSFLTSKDLPDELLPYKGRLTPRFFEVRENIVQFIKQDIIPQQAEYDRQKKQLEEQAVHPTLAREPPLLSILRSKAKQRGLYNFFLPEVGKISVLEYAPIAEVLGMFPLANQAMNCSAPDTGNMEVLEKYGTTEQKKQWLEPLLAGEIRSCFAMTEPGVASSDASQISASIKRDGDFYVINAHKWYITGAMRPECKVAIFMGRTREDGPLHKRHSMLIVPMDAPGVQKIRPMAVFGHEHDHAEIIFHNVRVPVSNILLGEGRGFEIAQGRLGPGRIHHCMRTIGVAEVALAALVYRASQRTAFGSKLRNKDSIRQTIAEGRLAITECRQLCYLAATMADEKGFKAARKYIAMIKVAAPRMALHIIDEAIQVHGAHGVSQDSKLSELYMDVRTLKLADGPDIVHLNTVVKEELRRFDESPDNALLAKAVSGVNANIAKYGKFQLLSSNL
eukprot:gb/GEZN01003522.1/.p1 GENE.gb/GEZN01003522.1/~~gb/GEZN01003522.1/.p1  ORF type:complete len:450 (-),score=54.43 gb/GEZN01003522.1/:789-2138(-)